MSDELAPRPTRRSWLALVDYRPGELRGLLLCTAWIFLALTAYYIIKPVRSTVLQRVIGVDHKAEAILATTVAVGIFAVTYGRIATRISRRALLMGTYLSTVGCLSAFALAFPHGSDIASANRMLGYVFFVWVSTFNLLIVSQFWSVAAEVWNREQGTRLFGAIGIGAVAGGIFGTQVVGRLGKQGLGWVPRLDTHHLLLLAAFILLGCLALALATLGASRSTVRSASSAPQDVHGPSHHEVDSYAQVFRSPYLRSIAAMMLLLNVVNTNNEWIMDKVLSRAHLDAGSLNAWYADFYFAQNVLTFLVQLLLTSRIQRHFGARGALSIEPAIGLLGGLSFLAWPTLATIRTLKIGENAADYSVQSNTRELLYVPVTPTEKYAAKSFNDTFVVRFGDAIAAGSIKLASTVLVPRFGDLGLHAMVVLDLILGVCWLAIVVRIGRMHHARMEEQPSP